MALMIARLLLVLGMACMVCGCDQAGNVSTPSPAPTTIADAPPADPFLLDSPGSLSDPDAPTYVIGASAGSDTVSSASFGQIVAQASSITPAGPGSAPYANQLADGCSLNPSTGSGHCGHTALLMAAAQLAPAEVEKIAGCSGVVFGRAVLPLACVRAAQARLRSLLNQSSSCGAATSADDLVAPAKALFGLTALPIRLGSAPVGVSDRDFVRDQIRNAILAGGLVLINVSYQNYDTLASRSMVRPTSGPGHWMLIVDERDDANGRATDYVLNNPAYPRSPLGPALTDSNNTAYPPSTYNAESVLDVAVDWQLSRTPARDVPLLVVLPPQGPRIAMEAPKLPVLSLGAPYSFAFSSIPADATFSYEGTLPPGLELSSNGILSGTPSAARDQPYEFTVVASYNFGSSVGTATAKTRVSVTVKGDQSALAAVGSGNLGTMRVGDVLEKPVANYFNKAATYSIENGGSAVSIVQGKLRIAPQSAQTLRFRLRAQAGSQSAFLDMTLVVYAATTESIPRPSISSVDPSRITIASGAQRLTVTGANFTSGAMAELQEPDGTRQSQRTPTTLTTGGSSRATFDIPFTGKPGNWRIVIVNRDNQRSDSFSFVVQLPPVSNPRPVIASVSPSPVSGADAPQSFTINGSGFRSGANVTLRDRTNGQTFANRTISAMSATSITLRPNFTNATATWSVEVINDDGQSSGEFQFSVRATSTRASPPSISSLDPSAPVGSNSNQSFVISGANFATGTNIILRDRTAGETFANRTPVSLTSSRIQLSVNFTTAVHTWSVEVVNPDGQSSGAVVFQVTAPKSATPSITSVSPNPVPPRDGAQTFTINGANFTTGANIILRDVSAGETFSNRQPVTFSASRITLNVNFTRAVHSWSVEVINPDGRSTGRFSFQVK